MSWIGRNEFELPDHRERSVEVGDRAVPARVGYYAFGGRRHLVVWAHQNRDGAVLRTWCGIGHTASIDDARSARRPCPVCATCPR